MPLSALVVFPSFPSSSSFRFLGTTQALLKPPLGRHTSAVRSAALQTNTNESERERRERESEREFADSPPDHTMPSSNTTDRQLQDVNDKLTDLGFPSVVMADVAKPLPSLPANTVALIRDMFVEVTRGTPTASNPVPRNGRGFFRALEPFGISALYGTRPLTVNVLDFLCSELQTLRLKKFHESQGTSVPAGSGSSEAATPSSAANAPAPDLPGASGAATSALDSTLNKLATCLKIPAPNIKAGSSAAFLRTVLAKAQGIGPTHAAGDAGDTLLNADSLESRRDVLERINQALRADYRLRRQMLLQRADITIQSFLWTDHVDEGKLAEVCAVLLLAETRHSVFCMGSVAVITMVPFR